MDFIVADEKLNRKGYRLLMSGARTEGFLKNPIMLAMHEGEIYSVGRWENLRIENGQMLATAVFDEKDPVGKELKRKYDEKFMFAASVQHLPISTSSAEELLVPNQYRATVTEWELLEISPVNIPGNPRAVKLSLGEGETIDDVVPKLNFKPENKLPEMDLKNIALALGLSETSTEADILAAIKTKDATIEKLNADVVAEMLSAAGITDEADKTKYQKLAAADFETTKALLLGMKPEEKEEEVTAAKVLELAKGKNTGTETLDANDKSKWNFDQWSKNDPEGLLKLKTDKPEEYKALALAYKPE